MLSIKHTAQHHPWVAAIIRFLIVWLVSALPALLVIRVMAWSGVVITAGNELTLLFQPAFAGLLMAAWRWSPADAPEDVMTAIMKGMGAAVLVVWANVAAIMAYFALYPPLDAAPDFFSFWRFFGPPLLFSVPALITGFVGALIGAELAKHLGGNRRRERPGPTGAA